MSKYSCCALSSTLEEMALYLFMIPITRSLKLATDSLIRYLGCCSESVSFEWFCTRPQSSTYSSVTCQLRFSELEPLLEVPGICFVLAAYDMRSYKPRHLTPAEPPPSHPQEQLPFTQSTGNLFNPIHNHYRFSQPCADLLHPHQSQPTYSTTIPTAIPHRVIDPSHQLIANNANYPIPPLIPQPTMIGPPVPPPPSTLFMNNFPRQQMTQTNFRQTANTVQQYFGKPTMPISQTVFTTQPQHVINVPTDNSSATQLEPTNTALTHNRLSLQPRHTSLRYTCRYELAGSC